jgi:CMP-N,N'-diacetyllegionaminic acid synthase
MNIVTVIPARGGSKSIPKKNIRHLNGKPLLAYSIEYSLKCELVDRTIVSTDSEEIGQIAKDYGAEVPFIRPSELATDDTPDYPVFRHALDFLENYIKDTIDIIILLRPTSPLRPEGLIERGLQLIKENPDFNSVRSVATTNEHPYRQWKQEGRFITGYEEIVHEPYNLERQKLPPVLFQTGDIEIISRQTLKDGSISGSKVLPLIINHEEMFDIDYEYDIKLAENRLNKESERK